MRARLDRGATATEYALLVALFAVALIAAVDFVQKEGTETLGDTDDRVGVIEDTGAYQAPSGPGLPPPPPPPPPAAGTLAAPTITPVNATNAGGNKWNAFATITVLDTEGMPVAGVVVEFRWSSGGSPNGTCVTNDSGECSVQQTVNDPPGGSTAVTLQVNSMTKTGWTPPALPVTSGDISCTPPLNPECNSA